MMDSTWHWRSTFAAFLSWSLGKDEHSSCRYGLNSMVEASPIPSRLS
jgi:hypothetical protein